MKMKKILALVLSLILVIALAACGTTQTPDTQPGNTETPATETAQATAEGSDKVIELRWLSSLVADDAESAWFANVVDGFNKEYEGRIKINIDGVAGEAVNEKLATDAVSGTMPDLFTLNADAARFNLIADSGRAVDLTSYMQDAPELWDLINKDSAAAYTDKDGHLLGMPYATSYTGIYYNKDLFAQAGITEFPTTWDAFFDACDKIEAIGVAPIALMTGENSWTSMLTLSALIGSEEGGKEWLTSDPSELNYNDPVFVNAAEKLQTMLSKYTTADAIGATYAVAANNFLNGKAAMIANGPWMTAEIRDTASAMEGLADVVGYEVFPGNSVNKSENIAYGIGSTDPEKIEAAFEVLKYLARPEVYAQFLNVTGNSATIEIDSSLLEMDPIISEFTPKAESAAVAYDQMANCTKSACIDGLGQLLPDLASGALTAADFAAQLQTISDAN